MFNKMELFILGILIFIAGAIPGAFFGILLESLISLCPQ